MMQRSFARYYSLFPIIFLNLFPLLIRLANGQVLPGGLQTLSGYDVEDGTDPVCWLGKSNKIGNNVGHVLLEETPWSNELVKGFVLMGGLQLLSTCPEGNTLEGFYPKEFTEDGEIMRTGRYYDYKVKGSITMDSLNGENIVSDEGPMIAVQIILCSTSHVSFCTPFVHEQANARLAAQNATVPTTIGDSHGGSHIHSPTVFIEMDGNKKGPQEFEVNVPTKVNFPGNFFAVAGIQLFTSSPSTNENVPKYKFIQTDGESSMQAHYKYDIANALPKRVINYEKPPTILGVSKAFEVLSWCLICIAVCAIMFLLWQTTRHFDNQILRLSQGPFLIIFLLSSITASINTFLYNPKNDAYCNLAAPMTFIPLQLMYAILAGRLWRSNALISPILLSVLEKEDSLGTKFFAFISKVANPNESFRKKGLTKRTKTMRRTVTQLQLSGVIFMFTLPQIIMQILHLTIQPYSVVNMYDERMIVGRPICQTSGNAGRWLGYSSAFVLWALIFILLLLAYHCRRLPSLFNETYNIFSATWTSFILVILCLTVYEMTKKPTVSADVPYLLFVVSILIMTTSTSMMIILPKLNMVWKNEKISISELVNDHRRSLPVRKNRIFETSHLTPQAPKDTFMNEKEVPAANRFDRNKTVKDGLKSVCTFPSDTNSKKIKAISEDIDFKHQHENVTPTIKDSNGDGAEENPGCTESFSELQHSRRSSGPSTNQNETSMIRIEFESPSPLVLKMIKAQRELEIVNRNILAGKRISHENWESVRNACIALGNDFDQTQDVDVENV